MTARTFRLCLSGQIPPHMRYSGRVNQGAHRKAPSGARDGRQIPLSEANYRVQNSRFAGLALCELFRVFDAAPALLARPRSISPAEIVPSTSGHPEGWTPNPFEPPDYANLSGFMWPKVARNQAVPCLTGLNRDKNIKTFFPVGCCATNFAPLPRSVHHASLDRICAQIVTQRTLAFRLNTSHAKDSNLLGSANATCF